MDCMKQKTKPIQPRQKIREYPMMMTCAEFGGNLSVLKQTEIIHPKSEKPDLRKPRKIVATQIKDDDGNIGMKKD